MKADFDDACTVQRKNELSLMRTIEEINQIEESCLKVADIYQHNAKEVKNVQIQQNLIISDLVDLESEIDILLAQEENRKRNHDFNKHQ